MDGLVPCPFCGAGETEIRAHTYWTGMRSETLSVELRHWCKGNSRFLITIKGRDEQEVLDKWRNRHDNCVD